MIQANMRQIYNITPFPIKSQVSRKYPPTFARVNATPCFFSMLQFDRCVFNCSLLGFFLNPLLPAPLLTWGGTAW